MTRRRSGLLSRLETLAVNANARGLSNTKAARMLGTTEGSFKVALSKGRKKLGIKAPRGGQKSPPDIPAPMMNDFRRLMRKGLNGLETRLALGIPVVDTIAIVKAPANGESV